ncbi:unnamed protein product [Urochloa humidicola]
MPRDGAARGLGAEAALAAERARGLREDGAARRLEVEAALAVERARGLRQAAASLSGVIDMEEDSPRIHAPELDDEGCNLDSLWLNRVEANGDSLASQLRKRTRPASAVNTSATIHQDCQISLGSVWCCQFKGCNISRR